MKDIKLTNIMTALNKSFTVNSEGNVALKVVGTVHAGTAKQENLQSKIRKSIDTANDRVRVVSTS
jgi:protein involved in polysaccharide export with SLBB domain